MKKQKVLSFGAYPDISLADARLQRDEARKKIRQNIDPSLERKAFKAAREEAVANTFELMAQEWSLKRNKQDDERLKRIFERHLFPYIGIEGDIACSDLVLNKRTPC